MSDWVELFALGGHGIYVLGAYAVGFLALALECAEVVLRRRNVRAYLRRLHLQ